MRAHINLYVCETSSLQREDIQQAPYSSSIVRQKLPVCFIINHIESIDDLAEKNDFSMNLTKAPIESRDKYEYISNIVSKEPRTSIHLLIANLSTSVKVYSLVLKCPQSTYN